jgi:hypothetical protein
MGWKDDPIVGQDKPTKPAGPAWAADPIVGPTPGEQQRAVVLDAVKANPDVASDAARLAKRYEVDPDVALRNVDTLRQREAADNARATLADAPALANTLIQRPFVAKQAHADLTTLAGLESMLKGVFDPVDPKPAPPKGGVLTNAMLRARMDKAMAANPALDVDTARALAMQGSTIDNISTGLTEPERPKTNLTTLIQGIYTNAREAGVQADQGATRFVADAIGANGVAGRAAAQSKASRDRQFVGVPEPEGRLARNVYGGLNSVVQQAPGLAASVITGNPAPALVGIFGSTFGPGYNKYRDRGATFAEATLGATLESGLEVATEFLPMKLITDKIGRMGITGFAKAYLGTELWTEEVNTILGSAVDTAIANPDKTWGDYFAELPSDMLDTAIQTLVQTGVLAGASRVLESTVMAAQAQEYRNMESITQADRLMEMLKSATDVKMREKSPEEFRAVVQEMVDQTEGAPDKMYVDAEVLSQLPGEVLAQLPGVAEQMQEALASGDVVAVSMADVLTVAPGTVLEQTLVEHGRIGDPWATSQFEAKQGAEQAQVYLQNEMATVIQQAADSQAMQDSSDRVRQGILDQLTSTKRFRKEVNEGYATWTAAFYTTMAGRLGITPEEMAAKYPLRIVDKTGAGAVLNTRVDQVDTPEFQNWFGDSKVVGEDGRPLVVYHGTDEKFAVFEGSEIFLAADRTTAEDFGDVVMPLYAAIRNPLEYSYNDGPPMSRQEAKAMGHDGWAIRDYDVGDEISQNDGLVYVAFDPTQIKSAIGNSGAFDPGDANILNQAARVNMKTGPELFPSVVDGLGLTKQEVDSTVVGFMTGLPGDMAFWTPKVGGIPEVVAFLEERRRASGLPPIDTKTPEGRAQIARLIAAEALAHIRNAGDSLEWYDKTINATVAQMAVKYPELNTDPEARTAFLLATAIASQGMNPETNLGFSSQQYGEFRKTGKFPEIGKGESAPAMAGNYKLANELLAEMGPELFRRFLATPFTVKELTNAGFAVGGENMDELVLGSSVFGPKIGFGFYSNLNGNFEPVTMDMWFMRTIGRLAGTLASFTPAKFAKQLARFRAGLKVRGKKSVGIFSSRFDKDLVKRAATNDDAAIELARLVKKAHEKDFKDNRADYDSGARSKTEMVAAADTMVISLDKPRDVPASGGERQLLRDVVRQVVDLVAAQHGQRVPPAALQALIWYPEQELYSALGVKLAVTSQDYSGAARKLLLSEGFNEQDLDQAVESAGGTGPTGARPANGSSNTGAAQANGPVAGRTRALEADAKARFLIERNRRLAQQSGGVDGRPQQTGNRGGRYSSGGLAPLAGAPSHAGATGPIADVVAAAERYAAANGIDLRRQAEYVLVDPALSKRIADAYAAMEHTPDDPRVQASYDALIRETRAQYDALVEAGYTFTFFDSTNDPYEGNPWPALRDLRDNKTMAVYGTYDGYGNEVTGFETTKNLLVVPTGLQWSDQAGVMRDVTANDLFRAVHDAFGHGMEGAGFRGQGEANAFEAHARLFSPAAMMALTTETRAQNSWLNYGPYAEQNQTANVTETVFADQKNGVLPEWTWTEGRAADNIPPGGTEDGSEYFEQAQRAGPGRADVNDGADGRSPNPYAVDVTGIHFSTGQRTSLDGRYFGTGLKGLEQTRLREATDPRIKERVYFYVDEGTGVRPEAGVGGYAHEVPLKNLYNTQGDPLKLFKAGDLNGSESRVLDAGYDGYYFPAYANQQGIAIVMGAAARGMAATPVANPTRAAPDLTPPKPYTRGLMSREINALDMAPVVAAAPSARLRSGTFQVDQTEFAAAQGAMREQGIELPDVFNQPVRVRVYHGTAVEGRSQGWTIERALARERTSASGASDGSLGTWFSASKDRAVAAASDAKERNPDDMTSTAVLEADLDLKNPLVVPTIMGMTPQESARLIRKAKKDGHDGVVFTEGEFGPSDYVVFDSKAAATPGTVLEQPARGTFNPKSLELALNENADLSTFFHETGHFFLEVMADLASRPDAPVEVREDMDKLLSWFGVKDMATWASLDLEGKRKYHERFAESIEQYVMEGKAPSVELQPVFRRFKSWLLSVYRDIKRFIATRTGATEIQLSNDVRRVLDRMLASQEQIAQAEEVVGLLPDENATEEAIEKLTARSIRDLKWAVNARSKMIKAMQDQAAKLRKEIEAEVTAEVDEMPAVQAKVALDKIRKDTKLQPSQEQMESIAAKYEYTSVDEMLQAIDVMGNRKDVIEGITDQRMLERHGDLIDQRAIEEAATAAVHNEARAKSLATELSAQAEMLNPREETGKTTKKGSKITVNAIMRAAKLFAANIVARTPVRDLTSKARQHLAAETRAGKRWQDATSKGDTQAAVKAKQDQVLNHAAAKAAIEAKGDVAKMIDYLKKFDKEGTRKNLAVDYLDQIDKLLEAIDLRVSTTRGTVDKRASLRKWVDEQHALGLDPILPENLLEDMVLTSYKEMTVEQITDLVDIVKNIEHLGRLKSKLLAAKDKREFGIIAQEIADSIRANGGKELPVQLEPDGKIKKFFKGAWVDHRKLNSLIYQMDGGVENGPFYRALVRSMNDAGTAENVMLEKATEALAKLYKPIEALPGGVSGAKIYIPEIKNSLSRAGRLSVALNWGNAQNRQRLMGGDNWTEGQVQAILKTLSVTELDFVNKVWEHIDSYWPDVKAKQLRVSGVVEDKVEAEPFTIRVAIPGQVVDGKTTILRYEDVQMRGGYYPIKYDPDRSVRAERNEAKENALQILRGAIGRATTRRGHTKARVEEVKGRPVMKDLGVITQHVNQVVHDLAWHEWFIDANRLMNDPRILGAIREHYGPEVHRALQDSAEAIAVGDSIHQGQIDKLLLRMRANVTRSIMGASLTTALLQPFGLTQSMARVGVAPVLKGAARWAGDAVRMESTVAWINGKSDFMRLRSKTFNRELREISQRVQGKSKFMQVADASLFMLMQKMQMVADVPTWVGAYEKALAGGVDDSAAVALADEAVLASQGGGTTKDLSAVQRNMPFLTQFYSYFNTTMNLVVEKSATTDFKNPRAVAGWVGDMVLLTVIPAILPALITYMLKGGDEDDPEKLAKKLLEWQAGYLLGMFVGLRELPTLWSPFDYGGPPAAKLLNDGKRLVQQAGQGEIDDAAVLATIGFLGTALGIPTTQVIRSYKGWLAWDEGDAPATSILFGPPPKD